MPGAVMKSVRSSAESAMAVTKRSGTGMVAASFPVASTISRRPAPYSAM